MEKRELALIELEERIKPLFGAYPLNYFKRNPSTKIDESKIPAVIIMEGIDNIIKRSRRDPLGYPVERDFNVIIEAWDYDYDNGGDVKDLRKQILRLALVNDGKLITGVHVKEKQTSGPDNLGIPGILGMQVVLQMFYVDSGPFN
jgi:hypothetical protein